MERYYTIPMEIGLAVTPGVDNIRSTSFYGLSFVRVTFYYGVDYYFALTQAAINLQQNVSLPNNVTPQILGSSLVGEIYRYQVVGPPHFGLTNLRTVQDWILQRRFLSVPGVVQVNTWGGTTKEYEVEVDLHKLDAYNVTLPQVISAVANANINVGGRTVNIGQQSVNIRGVGLIDSGGAGDLTQGYHVSDIENIVLGQSNGVPVQVKDVAQGLCRKCAAARQGRSRPRRRRGGGDPGDEPHLAHQRRRRPHLGRGGEDQLRRQPAAGSEDRPVLRTHDARRGDDEDGDAQSPVRIHPDLRHPVAVPRRSPQRHHRRRQHSLRAVLQHHHPGAAQRGRQPAVGRRRRFRHHRRCRGDPGRKHLSEFPGATGRPPAGPAPIGRGTVGHRPDRLDQAPRVRADGPTGCA